MGDVVAFTCSAVPAITAASKRAARNMTLCEESIFTAVLTALDEAEGYPKVRDALFDALGYDPCQKPPEPPSVA